MKKTILEIAGEVALEVAILAVYTWCAQVIWNNVVTDLFLLPSLTYIQTLNLLVLIDVVVSFVCKLNSSK